MKESTENKYMSVALTQRMPAYLRFLKEKERESAEYISSVAIAEEMGLNAMVVKKDISAVSALEGKPKVGFKLRELIEDIEKFLGYDNVTNAVIAGAGRLGKTLLSYEGFKNYGLNIVAAFDADEALVGKTINGKRILATESMARLCQSENIRLGIITVPENCAQSVAEAMVNAGILAIWNFAPVILKVPENVAVKNEDMAASLALLSGRLKH